MLSVAEHLKSRGMDINKYSMVIDEEQQIATFYLFTINGKFTGYQQYRPLSDKKKRNAPKDGRYYTYIPQFVDGIFGFENINYDDRVLYVTEGIFKAAVLHRLGFNAIAVLTSTPKRLKPWFRIMRATWKLVAIGDPDKGGKQLVDTVKCGFQSPLDLDEMEDVEILKMLGSLV